MSAPSGGVGRPGRAVVGAAVAGYLAGTLPSADIVSRVATGGRVDLRSVGSGNPGALNASQQLGTRWGLVVLAADVAKGAGAPVLGRRLSGDAGAYAAGTAAIVGHVAPVWKRFRGGKGVATSAGASLVLFPAYFPLDAAVAGIVAAGSADADRAIEVASVVWSVAALLWWRRGWPNAWGPPPGPGLALFATVGAAVMVGRVRLGRERS